MQENDETLAAGRTSIDTQIRPEPARGTVYEIWLVTIVMHDRLRRPLSRHQEMPGCPERKMAN